MTKPKLIDSKTWWRIYYERETELDMMPGGAQGALPWMGDYINQEEDEEFTMETEISAISNLITPNQLIKEMEDGIKEFGSYSYFDKGPSEVMSFVDIENQFKTQTKEEIHDFVKSVRGKTKQGSKRDYLCRELFNILEGLRNWTDEEWEYICEASPGSY